MSRPLPIAPDTITDLPEVAGVWLASGSIGLKKSQRPDLMIAKLSPGTTVAGTLTRTLCPAAPVDWCRRLLDAAGGFASALICNSGNANAFTGKAGEVSAALMAEAAGSALGVSPEQVFVASTGVIGESMPDDKLIVGIPDVAHGLVPSGPEQWHAAADAMKTTDTFAKGSHAPIVGTEARIVGIAKGSGMIAPDMATMLAFIFTDLAVSSPILSRSLSRSVDLSFNRITVDSDTSTNDSVLLFATGQSGDAPITDDGDPRLAGLQTALDTVTLDLAKQIVRDGEGATKLVAVTVKGAVSENSARKIAMSVAESPLVKTALAAEDANWGRIVMAVGKAGEPADRDHLAIWIGPELVADSGTVAEAYDESAATEHLRHDEVEITVDVGVGEDEATVWTCDLTHGYIEINAGYRT